MKKVILIILIVGFAFSQSVEFKDKDSNSLLEIFDEGVAGSILFRPVSSLAGSSEIKLYNLAGGLFWQDTQLGRSGWHDDGAFVRLLANSNDVGIGTNTPGAKLEVAGDIKIVDGTQGANKVLTSDASGLASWQTPASGSLWTPSASDIYYNSGNVGIGVTSPSTLLHVEGNPGTHAIGVGHFENTYTAGGYPYGIYAKAAAVAKGTGGYFVGGRRGIEAYVTPDPAGVASYQGVHAEVNGGQGQNTGVYGYGRNSSVINVGVFGKAEGVGAQSNWGGYFVPNVYVRDSLAIGTFDPDEKFEIVFDDDENRDVEIGNSGSDPDMTYITLRSPNETKYYIYVNDSGVLTANSTKP